MENVGNTTNYREEILKGIENEEYRKRVEVAFDKINNKEPLDEFESLIAIMLYGCAYHAIVKIFQNYAIKQEKKRKRRRIK